MAALGRQASDRLACKAAVTASGPSPPPDAYLRSTARPAESQLELEKSCERLERKNAQVCKLLADDRNRARELVRPDDVGVVLRRVIAVADDLCMCGLSKGRRDG